MSEISQKYGIYALYLTCFSCIFSSSLTSIFSVVMIICWLASGTYKNFPVIVKENPITIFCIAYCCLLLLGIFYSPAALSDSLDYFKKYRVLLFIPIVLSLTMGQQKVSRNIVNALLLGYLFVLVNAYLVDFSLLELNALALKRRGGGFLVIFAYLVLQRALVEKELRFLWGGFFLVICYDIFFILNTRTGWLIFIGLALLFFVQHFSIKQQVILFVFTACIGIGIFNTSDIFKERIDLTLHNLKNYDAEEKNSKTGLGLRLDWYQNSIALVKEKPLLGYGTGSFEIAQMPLIEGKATQATGDPHNEYFLTAVQIGLVGCVVLLLLLIDPVVRSFKLLLLKNRNRAFALQATVLFLVIGCFFNSWLLTSKPSHVFAFLIIAFYPIRDKQEETHSANTPLENKSA
ncbi:MAG: O-antigen ligase family protein [Desulfobulbaceae bacterium]|nr:O-antigen ligase family protein [Desulfobulbaceae bacterium]